MSPDTTVPSQLGNYDIVSKIADGGMGTVYKARHRPTGDIVAVKVIAPATAKNPILLQRFEREFVAARVLDHPNVVKAIEYCGNGPHPFLVMEYVDGESLGQLVERVGAISEERAVHIIAQICEGLHRAHKQGLVHRDVKPDNILVTPDGVAKLTDMGLVKDVEGDLNLTKTGRGLGTPHYMAPEQFRNAKNVDVRGDIYSLGATLYALVTGQVPFENANPLDCWIKKTKNEFPAPRAINRRLSERVDWAIRRAMSAEPDRRPASCREFLEDLTGQSRTTPTAPHLAGTAEEIWYFVYTDPKGEKQTRKGSTEKIREAIRRGLFGLPTAVLVSRSKTGRFQSLASVPEFRDLVVNPVAAPLPGSGNTPRPGGSDEVDLARTPNAGSGVSGRNSGRESGRPSGRHPAQQVIQTPHPTDPNAETEAYDTPGPQSRPRRTKPPANTPFDWTPVIAIGVMILSAVIGYIVLLK